MKKLLSIIALGSMSLLYACKDAPPEPTSPYYFRFEADGEAFDYKYECSGPFFGGGCTFGASFTGSATHHHFNIYGSSWEDKAATGEVLFYLNRDDVYEKDTIVLDGIVNRVAISQLKLGGIAKDYLLAPPLTGKIVIKERGANYLIGYFDFQTGNADGSIINIKSGEYYVPAVFN